MSDSKPLVLFSSCSNLHADYLIKQIFNLDELINGKVVVEDVVSYPWCIDTRYFTAEIELCFTGTRTIGDASFASRLEAFVLLFDTSLCESFDQVKLWLPYLKQTEPEIRLLVCSRCSSNDVITREMAWEWCLENGFELIELDPVVEENSDEEDDFKETTGIARIIQALHAHTWPNLVMKDKPSYRSSFMTQMMRDEAITKTSVQAIEESPVNCEKIEENLSNHEQASSKDFSESKSSNFSETKLSASDISSAFAANESKNSELVSNVKATSGFSDNFADLDASEIIAGTSEHSMASNEPVQLHSRNTSSDHSKDSKHISEPGVGNNESQEDDAQSFEDLFDKLQTMKVQAQNLPLEQRKLYAEKVAIQFWKAIGGDSDEIEGLSSDEEQT